MTAETPSRSVLGTDLARIIRNWDARGRELRRQNRRHRGASPLELPDTNIILGSMWRAAVAYVQRKQLERCPAKGIFSRDSCWRILLHQARDIYHEALGSDKLASAHAEIAAREWIVFEEACGDLECGAPTEIAHFYRLYRRDLEALLFRAVVAQAKALRDRRDGGEWWFPEKVGGASGTEILLIVHDAHLCEGETDQATTLDALPVAPEKNPPLPPIGTPAVQGEPTAVAAEWVSPGETTTVENLAESPDVQVRKRRGRPRRKETEWSRLLATRLAELTAALSPEPAINADELVAVLRTSRRRLCDLDARCHDNGKRLKMEERLMDPNLVNSIRTYRHYHPKFPRKSS
jgi:hypothetical protein